MSVCTPKRNIWVRSKRLKKKLHWDHSSYLRIENIENNVKWKQSCLEGCWFHLFLTFLRLPCRSLLINQQIFKVPVRFPVSQLTPKLDSCKTTQTNPAGLFFKMGKIVFMHIIVIRLHWSNNKVLYHSGGRTKWFTGIVGYNIHYILTFLYQGLLYFWKVNYFCFVYFIWMFFADILACCFYSFYLVIMVLLSVKSAVGSPPLTRHLPTYLNKSLPLFLYEQLSISPSLLTTS